jgi:Ca-activated chloride channel family protein
LIISDGDSEEKTDVRSIPSSIADSIVIGVGDPIRPTMVSGHRSTQDTASLKLLASKLNGVYHQGNNKQLPSHIVNKLTMVRPRVTDGIGLRELALACIALGGTALCFLGPALLLFGKRINHLPAVLVVPSPLKRDGAPAKNDWVKPTMMKNGVS